MFNAWGDNPDGGFTGRTPDQWLASQPAYERMLAEAKAMDLLNAEYDRQASEREQATGRVELNVPFLVFMVAGTVPASHRRN